MKLRPALIWMTLLTIGAMSIMPTRFSGVLGHQGKLTYQPTGSEGTITGKVSFAGKIPQRKLIDTSSDPVCQAANPELYTEDVIITAGNLANVFVYVSGDMLELYAFDAPKSDVLLAHRGCSFVPHVQGMQQSQTLKIANEDATTHNTHFTAKDDGWNQSQPENSPPLEKKFATPELLIPVRDKQHPWERAYISVLSHPFFAVSARNGSYRISGLPPGQYTVVARHERFGEHRAEISVGVSEQKNLDFTFKQPEN
jgi:Carboxypeptidase regulatory-like domain